MRRSKRNPPKARYSCGGCLKIFRHGEHGCCLNRTDDPKVALPPDEVAAVQEKCANRIQFLSQRNAA